MTDIDEYEVALRVAAVLEDMGIEYTLGGSLASSLYGEPRATNDVDFAVRFEEEHIAAFVERLGPDFVVDTEAFRMAVRLQRSHQVYFLPLALKIDFFVRGAAPLDRSEFARRIRIPIGERGALYAATAEDSLLRKLLWFKAGGKVSDRQWRDILGILRVSGNTLDHTYVAAWAAKLEVEDLFTLALHQA